MTDPARTVEALAALIEKVIDSERMERRLYPDLYAANVAEAIIKAGWS